MTGNGLLVFTLQNAAGAYPTSTSVQTLAGPAPGETLLIDLNGDGRPDLVTLSEGQPSSGYALTAAVNTGVGPSYFSEPTPFTLAGDPTKQGNFQITPGDLNGDGLPDLVVLDCNEGIINILRNQNGLIPQATPVTVSYGHASTLNYQNLKLPSRDLSLTVPSNVGSGNYTVSYQSGNVVVTDSVLGPVLIQPLTQTSSLTIQAPDGGRGSLTIDESHGFFSVPNGIHFVGSTSGGNTITLLAGTGAASVGIGAGGLTMNGRQIADWTNLDSLSVTGGRGNDIFSLSGDPHVKNTITLSGGPGINTYALATTSARIAIIDPTRQGTLDFEHATSGVTIDLGLAQGQTQVVGAGGNQLQLFGLIANVTGTPFRDVIRGNSLSNTIRGLGGDDVISGGDGNDLLDGGDGNDVLIAGSGNDILIGGAGNDTLFAGPGRDILIGGTGRDVLIGSLGPSGPGRSRGGSILIGRATVYDANDAALRALLAEWSSDRPLALRVANLFNGMGTPRRRLNGNFFLNAKTIKPEPFVNTLVGNGRPNWFLPGRFDRVRR
jgi:Ca2+-binding RTX toxin-like protein